MEHSVVVTKSVRSISLGFLDSNVAILVERLQYFNRLIIT